jgi:hypothetical protein
MITEEQIKFFAGTDNLEKSCLEILEELANGKYKAKQFQKDVLYHWKKKESEDQ